jgi:hypothetical protein
MEVRRRLDEVFDLGAREVPPVGVVILVGFAVPNINRTIGSLGS